jgi:hypothetical protein
MNNTESSDITPYQIKRFLKGVHYQRSLVQKFEELYGSIAETTSDYLLGTVLGADEVELFKM